ncbi:efflux RND transporter periplasmic adaptor subunit [Oryzomicrobium sp.]|uniref:efflux RND transporter periplasmic adaptor subunit n=1 Tax=Oryzomicrobium sp. TaxID=1911578 RepID=UPI002FE0A431
MQDHKNSWIARQTLRVGVLAVTAALAVACSKSGTEAGAGGGMPPGGLPVTVLEVQPQNLPVSVEVTAQTEGAKETEVRARVGGILLKRLYQEGAPVKAGQPLFQIDPAPYEIALADAKAKADQAAREEARLKGLIGQQAVSQKEYDDAASNHAIAQANLRQAQLNLSWTTVTAPVAGVSGRAVKSDGNLINTSDASLLTSIFQTNPMWVRFGLSESDVAALPGGQVKPGTVTGVQLILPDGTVYEKQGKINFLASNIDTTLGTQQLRAEFDNADGKLLPGQFVRVRLLTGNREGVFLVPQAAVLQTEQARLVMVVDAESKVAPRPVQTAEWRGKDWVITGGLKAGDKVIVDNLMKARPGTPVAPHGPQAEQGPAAGKGAAAPAAKAPAADEAKTPAQPAAQGKQ